MKKSAILNVSEIFFLLKKKYLSHNDKSILKPKPKNY